MRDIYDALSYSDDNCVDPSETLKNEMIPSKMRAKRNLKINREYKKSDYVYTEHLELDKQRNKPKIVINIPRFTKIVKVSTIKGDYA